MMSIFLPLHFTPPRIRTCSINTMRFDLYQKKPVVYVLGLMNIQYPTYVHGYKYTLHLLCLLTLLNIPAKLSYAHFLFPIYFHLMNAPYRNERRYSLTSSDTACSKNIRIGHEDGK